MKKFLPVILFFALLFAQCAPNPAPYKGLQLPTGNDYNEVIAEIIKQDSSIMTIGGEYTCEELPKITVRLALHKYDSLNPDLTFPEMWVHLTELKNHGFMDAAHPEDSVYFSFLNDSTKQLGQAKIDTTIVHHVNLISLKAAQSQSTYYQFFLPIFNRDKTKAFVEMDFECNGLCGEGVSYILEKVNNRWIIKRKIGRWVS